MQKPLLCARCATASFYGQADFQLPPIGGHVISIRRLTGGFGSELLHCRDDLSFDYFSLSPCSSIVSFDLAATRQSLRQGSKLSEHRSHFGSRYKLGCCVYAGLFCKQRVSVKCKNPATRNRARDHLISATIYSQMLYQLSYSRLDTCRAQVEANKSLHASAAAEREAHNTITWLLGLVA